MASTRNPRTSSARRLYIATSGLALFALACSPEAPAARSGDVPSGSRATSSVERPNLILISLDTLRADRLGCYGYDRPTSPAIDKWSARGVRFANTISESSWTLPSTMTMFTGVPPSVHGVIKRRKSLPETLPTVFEVLAQRGYRTFGFTAGAFVKGHRGFNRGFEEYQDEPVDFRTVLEQAQARIESFDEDEAYALFLHTFDVHCPYHPPTTYIDQFRTRPTDDHLDTEAGCGNMGDPIFNDLDLNAGQARFLSDQYDAGIRWVDDAIAEFQSFLDARNELSRTVLVLTSDHGEEFMEHGRIGHQRTLNIETLRIPLIVLAPQLEPHVVEAGASLSDVMPTILELLDVGPPASVLGHSLVPLALGLDPSWADRALHSEIDYLAKLRSVIYRGQHFIEDRGAGASNFPEGVTKLFFDMKNDPEEMINLAPERADSVNELAALISSYYKTLDQVDVGQAGTIEMSDEDVRELEALGYGGGGD
ncbi:MAG: arylsulfatase A-like enzyme [Planctomycetota bacterium]|jgi:arylsulfatase A-like enzyme